MILIDSDPQDSARDWYAAVGEDNPLPPVVGMDRPPLFKNLKSIMLDDYDEAKIHILER